MSRPRRDEHRLLTAAELELMQVLWEHPGSVQEVLEALAGPPRAYTTVATLLKILEDKAFVRSEKDGRKLVYAPVIARDDYQGTAVGDVVSRLFGGDAPALVRTLVRREQLSPADLAAIRALLEGE